MDGSDEQRLIRNPDSTEEIPVLDIAPFLAGEPGARERIGARLKEISETIGFFYLVGHGVPQSVVDGAFTQSRRMHEAPLEKRQLMPRRDRGGYDSVENKIAEVHPDDPPISLRASFSVYREPGNPDRSDPYDLPNDWPSFLTGFKEPVMDYFHAIERMGVGMMPLWAEALGMPADYFTPFFKKPFLAMSMVYYPPQESDTHSDFGIKPHTDNTIMTILAQGDVPGLAVRMPSGHWRVADVLPGAFMINTGNSLARWSNGRFLSTKHHVINTTGKDRYSIPMFFGADIDTKIECLPSCTGPGNPAQYPPITYRELQDWYFFDHGYAKKSVGPDTKSDGMWSDIPKHRRVTAA